MQIYQKGPAVDFLTSSRWMRGASRMGFDCEGNQLRFLLVIHSGTVLTNWREEDMSSANNDASAHHPASRDVHRPSWVHVFMNTYMWVRAYESKLIVKHAYIFLLPTYTLSVCPFPHPSLFLSFPSFLLFFLSFLSSFPLFLLSFSDLQKYEKIADLV